MPITKQLKYLISKNIKNRQTYLETGVFKGESINEILDLNFESVIGIECNSEYVKNLKNKFSKFKNVKIISGFSQILLEEILQKNIHCNCIYLDAHGHVSNNNIEKHSPLLSELKIIKKYYNKVDLIIIDDYKFIADNLTTGSTDSWIGKLNIEEIMAISKSIYGSETQCFEYKYFYRSFRKRMENSYLIIGKDLKFKTPHLYNFLNIFYIKFLKNIINKFLS